MPPFYQRCEAHLVQPQAAPLALRIHYSAGVIALAPRSYSAAVRPPLVPEASILRDDSSLEPAPTPEEVQPKGHSKNCAAREHLVEATRRAAARLPNSTVAFGVGCREAVAAEEELHWQRSEESAARALKPRLEAVRLLLYRPADFSALCQISAGLSRERPRLSVSELHHAQLL